MIETDIVNNIAIVRVKTDRLDAGTGLTIKETVTGLLQGHPKCIIDMAEVKLVDSGGLGGLVATLKSVSVQNGRLSLAGLQKPVRVMFELSRRDRQFEMYEDLKHGLAALA